MKRAESRGYLLETAAGDACAYAWLSDPSRHVVGHAKADTEHTAICLAMQQWRDDCHLTHDMRADIEIQEQAQAALKGK